MAGGVGGVWGGRACRRVASLKTAAPITPATASAPAMTISSIWIEPAWLCDDESAAASGAAATTEAGGAMTDACAAPGSGCIFASELAVAGPALADELTPDDSGQRDAISDDCVFVSRAFVPWLSSWFAIFAAAVYGAAAAGHCPLAGLVGSICACGRGRSARASPTVRCVVASFFGATR